VRIFSQQDETMVIYYEMVYASCIIIARKMLSGHYKKRSNLYLVPERLLRSYSHSGQI